MNGTSLAVVLLACIPFAANAQTEFDANVSPESVAVNVSVGAAKGIALDQRFGAQNPVNGAIPVSLPAVQNASVAAGNLPPLLEGLKTGEDILPFWAMVKDAALSGRMTPYQVREAAGQIRRMGSANTSVKQRAEIAARAAEHIAQGLESLEPGQRLTLLNLPGTKLTEGQKVLLKGLSMGHSNREISEDLGKAEGTVKNSMSRMFKDLQSNRVTLALLSAQSDPAPGQPPGLTLRSMEVVRRTIAGQENKEIAEALGITEAVVKNRLRDIYDAFQVGNFLGLALRAVRYAEFQGAAPQLRNYISIDSFDPESSKVLSRPVVRPGAPASDGETLPQFWKRVKDDGLSGAITAEQVRKAAQEMLEMGAARSTVHRQWAIAAYATQQIAAGLDALKPGEQLTLLNLPGLGLSDRDRGILERLALGYSDEEIGSEMGLEKDIVTAYADKLSQRFHANREALAILADQNPPVSEPLPPLTPLDFDLVRLAIAGKTCPAMAAELGKSVRMIEQRLENLFDTFGAWSQLELAIRAARYPEFSRFIPKLKDHITLDAWSAEDKGE